MSGARRLRTLTFGALATCSALGAAVCADPVESAARPQRIDPRVPQTLVVGPPTGPAPTLRSDGGRRGLAARLPSIPRVAWRRVLEKTTPLAPLVRANGNVIIFAGGGELIELDSTGQDVQRLALSSAAPSSASLLSDGAVLIATISRELVVVRGGVVGIPRRVPEAARGSALGGGTGSGTSSALVLPGSASALARLVERRDSVERGASSMLPLDDGGAVVGFEDEIIAVDRDGVLRARTPLPASFRSSLVADQGVVLATLATGGIAAWKPGGELARVGRFTGPVVGATVTAAPGVLLGVVDGQTLTRFDVPRAATSTLLAAPPGTVLGPPSSRSGTVVMIAWTGGRTSVVEVDLEGRERRRVQAASAGGVDAGAPPQTPPGDVLLDPEGRVAFVTPEGTIGIVDRDNTVRTLGETACFRGRRSGIAAPPVGLVPMASGFLVACDNGTVLAIAE